MGVYFGMNRRTACLVALALVAAPELSRAQQPEAPPGHPRTADELFEKLATLTGLEATFVETKKMALLKVPLRSEGTLYYMRPGYLLRQVTTPKPSSVLITPERLQMTDAQGSRTMDLRSRPDVKLFVESFIKVLAGDRAALATAFDISFTRNNSQPGEATADTNTPPLDWTLTLTPKSSPLNHIIRRLALSGKGYAVQRIEVLETKGDSSTTELQVKSIGRVFSPEEKQRLFGITSDAALRTPE
jgi:outer membrane lipoprotein-sorting protein